jgi:glycosyltransferase involved in cell wall biosynthesis
MASGVPVVQPRAGAFPEILEKTGGGVLVEPGSAASLADGIYGLWKDPELAAELGRRGAQGVRDISAPRKWRRGQLEAYQAIATTRAHA